MKTRNTPENKADYFHWFLLCLKKGIQVNKVYSV